MMKSRLLLVIIACLLQACVTRLPPQPVEFEQHQARVTPLNYWQIKGKLGIKAPSESLSASIHWQQMKAHYVIQLHGPLGQKSLRIEGGPKLVTLKEKGKEPVSSSSAESLFTRTTGWSLPLKQLDYWIRGLPAPGKVQSIAFNPQGLVKKLEQKDWLIEYEKYQTVTHQGHTLYLPQKLIATHQDLRLTLLIRDWTLD
jgi:outer membrane lipoprotein LolB